MKNTMKVLLYSVITLIVASCGQPAEDGQNSKTPLDTSIQHARAERAADNQNTSPDNTVHGDSSQTQQHKP